MNDYHPMLISIAKSVNLRPEILHKYLYGTIDPIRESVLITSRLNQVEAALTDEGQGVFFCLIRKSTSPSYVPKTNNDYISQVLQGIYKRCNEEQYEAQYRFNHATLATEDYFRSILQNNPDSSIIMLIPQNVDIIAEICEELGVYCVALDYERAGQAHLYTVNVDNYSAVFEMTQDLIDKDHKRIAFITGNLDMKSAQQRLMGYKRALEENGIRYDDSLVKYGNWQIYQGYKLTQELLQTANPPTAVVCSNDLSALGAYDAILTAGLRIPNDISVVGFDDIPLVANISPALTTVRQPMELIGHKAASLIIQAMEGKPSDEYEHKQILELVWRDSVKAYTKHQAETLPS